MPVRGFNVRGPRVVEIMATYAKRLRRCRVERLDFARVEDHQTFETRQGRIAVYMHEPGDGNRFGCNNGGEWRHPGTWFLGEGDGPSIITPWPDGRIHRESLRRCGRALAKNMEKGINQLTVWVALPSKKTLTEGLARDAQVLSPLIKGQDSE